MAEQTANPQPDPKPPATPPVPPPANPAAPSPSTPPPGPQPAPVATLTLDQIKELLAEREKAWEAERVPKLREEIAASITTPMQADTLIRGLRHELQQAGVYLPADDDDTDPDHPGELKALDPADHAVTLRTNKDGTRYTKLNREINRLRTRLLADRKPKRTGADALGTPPVEPGGDDFLDKVADDARKERESKRSRPTLADVYGGFAPAARR